MSKQPESHVEIGSGLASNEHYPGTRFHRVKVVMSRRSTLYRCRVLETWGSDQGYLEEHGRREVIGHGSSLASAATDAKALAKDAGIDASFLAQALSKALQEAYLDDDQRLQLSFTNRTKADCDE
jgi:hypothetical protein